MPAIESTLAAEAFGDHPVLDPVRDRSNVEVVSNVYVRDPDERVHAASDAAFRARVRGYETIKEIYEHTGIISRAQSIGTQDLRLLPAEQQAELRNLPCSCGRVDHGPVRRPDGKVVLRPATPCICRR